MIKFLYLSNVDTEGLLFISIEGLKEDFREYFSKPSISYFYIVGPDIVICVI